MPPVEIDPKSCGICALNARIRAGQFRDFIAELPKSYVILGDAQLYRGYCILFARYHATELFLMPPDEARALFDEMRSVAEAIATVVRPLKMNYDCLGNVEPHVHWHLFPRHESDDLRRGPVWMRPERERKVELPADDHRNLIASLRSEIVRLIPSARVRPTP
ncbi:MAG TPA: HIT family protein [Candidatus Binataceae bacterium]